LERIENNIRKQSVCISVQIERHIEMDEKVKFLTEMDASYISQFHSDISGHVII